MKLRLLALILTLSLVVWAQGGTSPSTAPNTPAPEAKACCHHMADAKDGHSCCHHASADAKDAGGCCGKDKCEMKDGKSCCGENATDMKACMDKCEKNGGCAGDKGCCSKGATEKTASCCGNKCERHQHAASTT